MGAKEKGIRITLLVEDEMIERFARRVLEALGYATREMFFLPYPIGKGSNKQWLNQNYAKQVKIFRSKANNQKIALLVATDADEMQVLARRRSLEEVLQTADPNARNEKERIALWIPRWNIETWVLALSGEAVNEDKNEKTRVGKSDLRAVAAEFVRQYRELQRGETVDALPSLRVAYVETTRIAETA